MTMTYSAIIEYYYRQGIKALPDDKAFISQYENYYRFNKYFSIHYCNNYPANMQPIIPQLDIVESFLNCIYTDGIYILRKRVTVSNLLVDVYFTC